MRSLLASILAIAMFLWLLPALLRAILWRDHDADATRLERPERAPPRAPAPRGARLPSSPPDAVDL